MTQYDTGQIPEDEAQVVSKWHEGYIKYLLEHSGMEVQQEPLIKGMTPDLIARHPDRPDIIVECLVKLMNPDHRRELAEKGSHLCGGDIKELHAAVYSRMEDKAAKYQELIQDRPYIIALYDCECMSYPIKATHLGFSAHVQRLHFSKDGQLIGTDHADQWSTPEQHAGLFIRYPHLSGILYSRWPEEHYFLPNPFASTSPPTNLFPFAHTPTDPIPLEEDQWQKPATQVEHYPFQPNTWWALTERLIQRLRELGEVRLREQSPPELIE